MSDSRFEWTRLAAVIVSVCALSVTALSAFAAWQSWRTAEASLSVARQNIEVSGAVIELGDVLFFGNCDWGGGEVAVNLEVRNEGRLPTRVAYVAVYLEEEPVDIASLAPLAFRLPGDPEVAAQQSEQISLPIGCTELNDREFPRDGASLAEWIRVEALTLEVHVASENGDKIQRRVEDPTGL